MKQNDRPKAAATEVAFDSTTAGATTLLIAIGDELDWQPLGGYRTGPCPACGLPALAWDRRQHEPDDRWRCTGCGDGGSLFSLHHRAALHGGTA